MFKIKCSYQVRFWFFVDSVGLLAVDQVFLPDEPIVFSPEDGSASVDLVIARPISLEQAQEIVSSPLIPSRAQKSFMKVRRESLGPDTCWYLVRKNSLQEKEG